MPRVVTYEDAAIFNLICHYGQPVHPPGYPLYSMLCFPFAHLPLLSRPLAGNILSALLGAAACAVLYLVAVHLTGGRLGGYMAGFAYGFSKLFWSQSIIQKVYSLHVLLFLLILLLTLVYAQGRNPTHLKGFAVVCRLGLSNHWILTILAALVVVNIALSKLVFNNRSGDRFAFNHARMEFYLLEQVREDITLYKVTGQSGVVSQAAAENELTAQVIRQHRGIPPLVDEHRVSRAALARRYTTVSTMANG